MKRILFAVLFTAIAFGQVTPKGQQSDNYTTAKKKGGVVLSGDMVDEIMYPRQKPVYGADGSVTDVSPATPLPTWGGAGFALNAAMGNITGLMTVNKFGRNTELDAADTSDIWDGGLITAGVSQIWVAPTAAAVHNIVSSSDVDSVGLAGALTIQVYGLPRWTSAEISEVIILDGTNAVATDCLYVIIHRMKVLTKGASGPNAGKITATATSPSATTVTAQINIGQGQTQMAIYGIPSTQTLYLTNLYGSVNKAVGAAGLVDVSLLVNPEPQTELTGFLVKHTFGLQTVGTSALPVPFAPYKPISGPAIIKVQAFSGTNDNDISAGFDGYLVTN